MHPLGTMHRDYFVCRQSVHLFSVCPSVHLSDCLSVSLCICWRHAFRGILVVQDQVWMQGFIGSILSLGQSVKENLIKVFLDNVDCLQCQVIWATCTANQWRITRMFIFHVNTSYFWQVFSGVFFQFSVSESDWLLNVTFNDISVTYVTDTILKHPYEIACTELQVGRFSLYLISLGWISLYRRIFCRVKVFFFFQNMICLVFLTKEICKI